MKFSILKTNLLNALNTVSKAISNKNPNAILTGVKLELNELGLTLIGTDTDISISTFVSKVENDEQIITIFETGSVIISCKYILDIVRKFDSEVIEFELVENSLLKVRDNLSDFSLNTMKVEDFPNIDFEESGSPVTIKSESLREIIDQTCFAASDKETRPILTGVNFKANGKVLECVATDSYRLAKKIINLDENSTFNVTIPAKTLNEIGKILETELNITLSISSKKIIFNLKNTKISTRLISGVYPDTSKIIPTSFLYSLDSSSQSIVNAIDRASLLSPEKSNFVKMSLSEDSFVISSKSLEIGSVVERIKNFIYHGDRLDISFTARYVIDAIRAIGSEEVTILLNGDMKTFIIKNKNDDSNIQLVQPVRTY